MNAPELWPIPWLSPSHALFWLTLLLIPTFHGLTGYLIFGLATGTRATSSASLRWDRVVLVAILPLALAWMATRWMGTPRVALVLEQTLWPAFAGLAVGIVILGAAAIVQAKRSAPSLSLCACAATGGTLLITCWALVQSFQIDPGAWLETRTLRLAVQPPALALVLPLHLASTCTLGATLALLSGTQHQRLARTVAALAAACACVIIVSMPWWLPPQAMSETAHRLSERGASGPAWTTRFSVVALAAFASLALSVNLLRNASRARSPLLLAVLAACASLALVDAHRGPFSVRGWCYEKRARGRASPHFSTSPFAWKREERSGS